MASGHALVSCFTYTAHPIPAAKSSKLCSGNLPRSVRLKGNPKEIGRASFFGRINERSARAHIGRQHGFVAVPEPTKQKKVARHKACRSGGTRCIGCRYHPARATIRRDNSQRMNVEWVSSLCHSTGVSDPQHVTWINAILCPCLRLKVLIASWVG